LVTVLLSSIMDKTETSGQDGFSQQVSHSDESNVKIGISLSERLTAFFQLIFSKFSSKKKLFVLIFILIFTLLFILTFRLRGKKEVFFGKKGEIVWWGLTIDETEIVPLVSAYEKENPGIRITYIKQSEADYREKLTNSLIENRGPDIFEIHNSWPLMFASQLAKLPPSIMEKKEFEQTFHPIITSDLTLNGAIVGIPLEYDALTLFINENIFLSAAKVPPRTWDDFINLVDPSRKGSLTIFGRGREIVQSGAAIGFSGNIDHWQEVVALMLLQNKTDLKNPIGKLAQDALSFFGSFSKMGVWNETLPSSTDGFADGRVAMYFGPLRSAFKIIKTNPELKFKTVRLPQLPKDAPQDPDYSYATYWVQSVWEKSVNRENSWRFLQYLSKKESLEKLNENIKLSRGLKKLSPRLDSANFYVKDLIFGSVVALAPNAKSWFLADETFDGEMGINSQVSKVFEKVLVGGVTPKKLEAASQEIRTILSKYQTFNR